MTPWVFAVAAAAAVAVAGLIFWQRRRSRHKKGIQCVLFSRAAEYEEIFRAGEPVDIIGHLDCQVWQGMKRLQFVVEKIYKK